MKRVQFSITYPEGLRHPIHREILGSGPISRAELLMWSPTAEATTLFRFDGDPPAVEAALTTIDSLTTSAVVADRNGTYAFLRQDAYEFAASILDAVADAAVIFVPPVVFEAESEVRFEAVGETAAVGDFHDVLSTLGDLDICRVHDFERVHSPDGLTDRQLAALEAAVETGYYAIPRRGSVADVAAELDCAASTAGELLRKAEAAVVHRHVDTQ
ncbi:MAG: helix-turn-helix domain-containing protein [Halobellus sp.]|uniref:helix-turn-helix domain-containing protein n=1 Tax=Halobellus sp. TaxID=1979212 RepID=UPI0035D49F16